MMGDVRISPPYQSSDCVGRSGDAVDRLRMMVSGCACVNGDLYCSGISLPGFLITVGQTNSLRQCCTVIMNYEIVLYNALLYTSLFF